MAKQKGGTAALSEDDYVHDAIDEADLMIGDLGGGLDQLGDRLEDMVRSAKGACSSWLYRSTNSVNQRVLVDELKAHRANKENQS